MLLELQLGHKSSDAAVAKISMARTSNLADCLVLMVNKKDQNADQVRVPIPAISTPYTGGFKSPTCCESLSSTYMTTMARWLLTVISLVKISYSTMT